MQSQMSSFAVLSSLFDGTVWDTEIIIMRSAQRSRADTAEAWKRPLVCTSTIGVYSWFQTYLGKGSMRGDPRCFSQSISNLHAAPSLPLITIDYKEIIGSYQQLASSWYRYHNSTPSRATRSLISWSSAFNHCLNVLGCMAGGFDSASFLLGGQATLLHSQEILNQTTNLLTMQG